MTNDNEAELRALMRASSNGDAAAYRALLHRLSKHLRAFYKGRLLRIGRSSSDAEDLVQEALMAIHTRRDSYDPEQFFTPWVNAIARYKLIDYLRRTRASLKDLPIDDADDILGQEDQIGIESALDFGRLLKRLPEKMQRAIRCVKIEGLSTSEAATKCGMSESAIKVSVHRGLKAMAATIAQGRSS